MSCSTGGGTGEQQLKKMRGVGGTGAEAEIPKLPRAMCRVTTASRAQPLPQRARTAVNRRNWRASSLHIPRKLALTNYGNHNFMYNMENYTFDRQMLRATSCSA